MSSNTLGTLCSATHPIPTSEEIRRALDALALAVEPHLHEQMSIAAGQSPMLVFHDQVDEAQRAVRLLAMTFESCLARSRDETDEARGPIGMW